MTANDIWLFVAILAAAVAVFGVGVGIAENWRRK